MKVDDLTSRQALVKALAGRPAAWAQMIATRSALRAAPGLMGAPEDLLAQFALTTFRTLFICWAACSRPHISFRAAVQPLGGIAANTANIIFHSSTVPRSEPVEKNRATLSGPWLAAAAAESAAYAAHSFSEAMQLDIAADIATISGAATGVPADSWRVALSDIEWLLLHEGSLTAARELAETALWPQGAAPDWHSDWIELRFKLNKIDPNFGAWVDWYEMRIVGDPLAFVISGDVDDAEETRMLRRLAEATDEDFWGKGHEYVNAELTRWLEEARTRTAGSQTDDTPTTPPQDPRATTYGINQLGQLDRLPPADQVHLRDVPDQRRSYADLRAAVFELLQEGQRLGPRLQPRLERFGQSLPEDFERAEAYLVWRDGIALRRLYRAHLAVAKGKDPDPARLEPAAAEGLGEVLDLYNPFAFADDGIRAKDEATIAPQERADAEAEAAAAAPLVTAVLAMPEIATPQALGDIAADADDAELPGDDPYAAQALDQAARTRRNLIAAMVSDTWTVFKDTGVIGKAIAGGAAWDGIKLIATTVGGIEFAPLLEFIAAHTAVLQSYVAVAFTSFPHLPHVIDQISALRNRIQNQ